MPQQTLAITGLPGTGVPQGVSVLNNRVFIGLVSTIGIFTPKIVEVDPNTGAVLAIMNTVTPQITTLGDDGTNLLILNSSGTWDVYTYTTAGAL